MLSLDIFLMVMITHMLDVLAAIANCVPIDEGLHVDPEHIKFCFSCDV